MKTYIEYGWPEGKRHGRLLMKALRASDYTMAVSPSEADVIIAHSAGCYMISSDSKSKVILLVGLPNWPNRPTYKCTLQKVKLETKNAHWFAKTLFHIIYAFRIPTTLRIWKAFQQKSLKYNPATKVILIRNQQDTYMEKTASLKLANEKSWQYQEIPGQHDDIWDNPWAYVEMINQELENISE